MNNLLELLHIAEKLKKELRHSWLSNGRQESVAEHSWRVSLMAMILYPHLQIKVDLLKSLKIAIIHDLAEAEAYDIPAFETHREQEKKEVENNAMKKIQKLNNNKIDEDIFSLWLEYEEQKTNEAKFIKALDKIEVRLQHNEADIKTWNEIEFPRSLYVADEFCKIDKALEELNELIKNDSKLKIKESGKDFIKVQDEAEKLSNSKKIK